jgi:hypothetical protein
VTGGETGHAVEFPVFRLKNAVPREHRRPPGAVHRAHPARDEEYIEECPQPEPAEGEKHRDRAAGVAQVEAVPAEKPAHRPQRVRHRCALAHVGVFGLGAGGAQRLD